MINHDWECEHCGRGFKTEAECDHHEISCKKRPTIIRGKVKPIFDVWQGIRLGIGFGIGLTISSVIIILILTLIFGGAIAGLLSQIL